VRKVPLDHKEFRVLKGQPAEMGFSAYRLSWRNMLFNQTADLRQLLRVPAAELRSPEGMAE